jgi:tRNA(Arg) A34 adenosine deaminase TadA
MTSELTLVGLSGITWSGFDNFTYLFSYEQTRDAFAIPHDIKILQEVSLPLTYYRVVGRER